MLRAIIPMDRSKVTGPLLLAVVVSLCSPSLAGRASCYADANTEKPDISELYVKNCARCHGKDGKGKAHQHGNREHR